MNSPRKLSRQDILRRQQQSTFVGREDQLASFRHNLTLSPEDWRFLFNVSGQGGVGKSSLIRQFRKIAEEAGFITAYTSESENNVPEVMGRLAEQLEQQGYKLNQFSERYKVYRQKKQELEADPDAPQGFSAFLGRSLAKAGLGLAKQVPGSGAVTPFLDEETIATQAGEWASYVARKLGNKDEVRLVQEPVEVLTPLFLQDIGRVVEKVHLTLFFDTYERTSDFLDSWLREILEGRYGDLPINVIVVIAGREELSLNDWADYEGSIARLPLEPFTEDETRQYLARKGVTNPQVVDVILRLSGCLPLLVATLAVESPNDPDRIGDPSETAVERFLKWVDDPKRRQVALDAALPLRLNRDIIAVLHGEDNADELFNWLRQMPFVEERSDCWVYHDIARAQMLRHKRLTSPQSWAELHAKLADHYDEIGSNLQLEQGRQYKDTEWQQYKLNALYHLLCQSPQRHLLMALNEFAPILDSQIEFAQEWAETILKAGRSTGIAEIQDWGKRLTEGLKAYNNKRYIAAVEMFTGLLNHDGIETKWRPIVLTRRGNIYGTMRRYRDALNDFNEAIELDPSYKRAIASRGFIYRRMKCGEEAFRDFQQVVKLDPSSSSALANRGYAYRLLNQYEEALRDFDRAIEFNPTSTWALYLRAKTYIDFGRYENALKDFDRAIELNPEYVPAIGDRAWLYVRMQRIEEALTASDHIIELDPGDSKAIALRGQIYLVLERYAEGLIDLNHAIELRDDNDWQFYSRALAHLTLNQSVDAKADFDRAVQLAQQEYAEKPEYIRNVFNLALYLLAAGNVNQAKHFYRDALNRNPPTPSIREAIHDLEDFLRLFPKHEWAKKVKAALERKLAGE